MQTRLSMLHKLGMYLGNFDRIAGAKFTVAVNAYQKKMLKYSKVDGEITAKVRCGGHCWVCNNKRIGQV